MRQVAYVNLKDDRYPAAGLMPRGASGVRP